jgi:hypothetical protein
MMTSETTANGLPSQSPLLQVSMSSNPPSGTEAAADEHRQTRHDRAAAECLTSTAARSWLGSLTLGLRRAVVIESRAQCLASFLQLIISNNIAWRHIIAIILLKGLFLSFINA